MWLEEGVSLSGSLDPDAMKLDGCHEAGPHVGIADRRSPRLRGA